MRTSYTLAVVWMTAALCAPAFAGGRDFAVDFIAAAPLSYDHGTGGGAYNDRSIGRDKDVVESLEGGDSEASFPAPAQGMAS